MFSIYEKRAGDADRLMLALVSFRMPKWQRCAAVDCVAAGYMGAEQRLHWQERVRRPCLRPEYVVRRERRSDALRRAGSADWSGRRVLLLVSDWLPERHRCSRLDDMAARHVGSAERLHRSERLR